MRTIWEILREKATPKEKDALAIVQNMQGVFCGYTGGGVAPTMRPTTPLFENNPLRENCIVSASATNTGNVYFSTNQDISLANFGFVLSPGDSLTLFSFKGALYCWSDTANQKFGFMEW